MSWWAQLSVFQQGAVTFTVVFAAVGLLWRRFRLRRQSPHPT